MKVFGSFVVLVAITIVVSLRFSEAASGYECHTCYKNAPYVYYQRVATTLSTNTRCFGFFRCTRYYTEYRIELHTGNRLTPYCCRKTKSAGLIDYPNGALRLDSSSATSGKLNVFYSGRWGTVCDDEFSQSDANVACYQLGFTGSRSHYTNRSKIIVNAPIWLDDLNCEGNELKLTSCGHSGWGIHNCQHSEDVSISCNNQLQVRLTNGGSNPFQGRVLYYMKGAWSTICDDSFTIVDANVVCNQLGYGNATRVSFFGAGTGSIVFDDVGCVGNEVFLHDCSHAGLHTHNCQHSEDVGVVCNGPTPKITNATASSQFSVTLQWELPWQLSIGSSIVRGYRIQYSTSQVGGFNTVSLSTTQTSYQRTITGLSGSTRYYFRVSMYTVSKDGPYSALTAVTTKGCALSAPTNLRGTTLNSNSISVTWAYNSCGSQSGFGLTYAATSSSRISHQGQINVGGSVRSYTLTGLEEGVNYQITVTAISGDSNGPAATIYQTTRDAAPSAPPQNVRATAVSSTSITVSWSAPDVRHQNGIITGYTVSGAGFTPTITTSTSVTLSGLSPYQVYRIRVAARNSAGTGPLSSYVTVTTYQAVPSSPPTGLIAKTISPYNIHLQWSAPASSSINGVPVEYVIAYGKTGQGLISLHTGGTGTRHDFSRLQACSEMRFRVAIKNSIGTGPFSSFTTATTHSELPTSAPSGFTVTAQTATTVRVAWSAFASSCPLTSFKLAYSNDYRFRSFTQSTISPSNHDFTASGLKPYTVYYFKLAAVNINGTGPFTAMKNVRTFTAVPTGVPQSVHLSADVTLPTVTISWLAPPSDTLNSPPSNIQYRLQYNILGDSSIVYINVGSVLTYVVSNLHYNSVYQFRVAATNSNGTGPYSPRRVIQTVSQECSPPRDIQATLGCPPSVILTWNVPEDCSDITGYNITYGTIETDSPSIIESQQRRVTIDNLDPFATYYFRVTAVHHGILGTYSSDVFKKTCSTKPTGAPSNIKGTMTSTSITVSWNAPKRANGLITGYNLKFRKQTSRQRRDSKITTVSIGGHVTNYTIQDLDPYTTYCIQMSAVNINGTGPFSTETCYQTLQGVPGVPASITVTAKSSTSLLITWSAPTLPNGVIVHYLVSYVSTNSGVQHQGELSKDGLSQILNGLHEGIEYSVEVRAVTTAGTGEAITSTGRTFTAVPTAAPQNLTAKVLGPYNLSLSWQPPQFVDQNGVITNYVINYTTTQVETETTTEITTGEAYHSFVLENLKPFTAYTIKVAAQNINGTGPYSVTIEVKTAATVPSAPTNLVLSSTLPTNILVTWEVPASPNGMLQGYRIEHIVTSPTELVSESESVIITINTTSYTLSGLHEGTKYRVNVSAINEIGEGAPATNHTTTRPTRPGASPLNVTVVDKGTTYIDLGIEPIPAHLRNGPLIHYIVQYGLNRGNKESTDKFEVEDETVRMVIRIEGLKPYTEYFYQVAVENVAGKSDYSDKKLAVTNQEAPSGVVNLTALTINATLVVLAWGPPEQPNGDIIYYEITDGKGLSLGNSSSEELTFEILDLSPLTLYRFGVRAYNLAGSGKTEFISVKTPADLGSAKNDPLTQGEGQFPFLAALIGVGIALPILIAICIIGVVVFCCFRYFRLRKLSKPISENTPYPQFDNSSGIYEEIPGGQQDYFEDQSARKEKEIEATANLEPSIQENDYYISTTLESGYARLGTTCEGGEYAVPIINDPSPFPMGGDTHERSEPPDYANIIQTTENGVHYSVSLENDTEQGSDTTNPYDTPKGNKPVSLQDDSDHYEGIRRDYQLQADEERESVA